MPETTILDRLEDRCGVFSQKWAAKRLERMNASASLERAIDRIKSNLKTAEMAKGQIDETLKKDDDVFEKTDELVRTAKATIEAARNLAEKIKNSEDQKKNNAAAAPASNDGGNRVSTANADEAPRTDEKAEKAEADAESQKQAEEEARTLIERIRENLDNAESNYSDIASRIEFAAKLAKTVEIPFEWQKQEYSLLMAKWNELWKTGSQILFYMVIAFASIVTFLSAKWSWQATIATALTPFALWVWIVYRPFRDYGSFIVLRLRDLEEEVTGIRDDGGLFSRWNYKVTKPGKLRTSKDAKAQEPLDVGKSTNRHWENHVGTPATTTRGVLIVGRLLTAAIAGLLIFSAVDWFMPKTQEQKSDLGITIQKTANPDEYKVAFGGLDYSRHLESLRSDVANSRIALTEQAKAIRDRLDKLGPDVDKINAAIAKLQEIPRRETGSAPTSPQGKMGGKDKR